MIQQIDVRRSSLLYKRIPHIPFDMLPTPVVKPTVQRRGPTLATHVLHSAVQIFLAETFLHALEDQSQSRVELSPDLFQICFAVPLCVGFEVFDYQLLCTCGGVDATSSLGPQ
jgi:hypothetical protein